MQKKNKFRDAEGGTNHGLLTVEDFGEYKCKIEEPVSINYRGYDVYKCGPWTQGPVFLHQLNNLEGGKRPSTSLTPTLVMKEGKPLMVFGLPGAPQFFM